MSNLGNDHKWTGAIRWEFNEHEDDHVHDNEREASHVIVLHRDCGIILIYL